MTRKKEMKMQYSDSWIYILILSTLVILAESLKTYMFKINNISLTFSIFLLPFAYFITNYVIKKFGHKEALKAVIISTLTLVVYVFIMSIAVNRDFSFSKILGGGLGYLISQIINITIYYFLINNTNTPFLLIFLTYLFALVVNYMVYMVLSLNMLIGDNFWISYFSALLLQSIICLLLTFFDTQIKRGVD